MFNAFNVFDQENFVIAIDGYCGSGKTTLANELKIKYNADIVSMDDFFLPEELRTYDRLNEIGGNFHYERFISEVKPYLFSDSFNYQVYDCKKKSYTKIKKIDNQRIIVEGTYSHHPLIDNYDLKIFLNVSKEEQIIRLKNRDINKIDQFLNNWIPKENIYFEKFNIKKNSNIIINT